MSLRPWAFAALLAVTGARAHSLSSEVSVGATQDTPTNPHGTNVGGVLTARFELSDRWMLKLGGGYTSEGASDPTPGAAYGTSSASIVSLVGGLEWDVTERVQLYAEGTVSPSASQTFDSVVDLPRGTGSVERDALLFNATSAVGATLGTSLVLGGETIGGVPIGGTLIDLSAGWTGLSTRQRIEAIADDGTQRGITTVELNALRTRCARPVTTVQRTTCAVLGPLLRAGEDTLNQLRLALAIVQPVGSSTDLGIGGAYYAYDSDPSTAGFFTARVGLRTASFGGGFPLAPLRWTARPSVEQRFGRVSLAPWYQYSEYTSSFGHAHTAGAQVAVRLGESWRVWVSGSVQWDQLESYGDAPSAITSGLVTVGVRTRF